MDDGQTDQKAFRLFTGYTKTKKKIEDQTKELFTNTQETTFTKILSPLRYSEGGDFSSE